MLWVNRVTLRKSVGCDVIPAEAMRKTIAEREEPEGSICTVATTSEIEKLRKEIETLQGEVEGGKESFGTRSVGLAIRRKIWRNG